MCFSRRSYGLSRAGRDKERQREQVDLRLNGKSRIKGSAIEAQRPVLSSRERRMLKVEVEAEADASITFEIVDFGKCIDRAHAGFVPWTAETTNARSGSDDLITGMTLYS